MNPWIILQKVNYLLVLLPLCLFVHQLAVKRVKIIENIHKLVKLVQFVYNTHLFKGFLIVWIINKRTVPLIRRSFLDLFFFVDGP